MGVHAKVQSRGGGASSAERFAGESVQPDSDTSGFGTEQDLLFKSLLLGLFEQAVNKALRQDHDALAALRQYSGCIFRIKTYHPYAVVYCQFCDEGITLLTQYDGEVDARVQAPAGKLLMLFLQQERELNQEDFEIRILGDRALVEEVLNILKTYDIWRWVRQFWLEWFPGAADLPSLMDKLQLQTPQWWAALQAVPGTTHDLLVELKHLSETQTKMLAEIKALREAQGLAHAKMSAIQWLGLGLMLVGVIWFAVSWFSVA